MISSIEQLMPTGFFTEYQSTYIPRLRKFVFNDEGKNVVDNLTNFIKNADDDLNQDLTELKDVDLTVATKEERNKFMKFINNVILICNLDYENNLNSEVNTIQKVLYFYKKLGSGAEGTVFDVSVKFNSLYSPKFVMKIKRMPLSETQDSSTTFLKEYMNYYAMNFISDYTPNMVCTIGLLICNAYVGTAIDNNETLVFNKIIPGICGCNGKFQSTGTLCRKRNYMLSFPFSGSTIDDFLVKKTRDARGTLTRNIISENCRIFIDNFDDIFKQILISMCIAQDKLGLLHNDLNLRNMALTKLEAKTDLKYLYMEREITINTNLKLNIFDFGGSKIQNLSFLELDDAYKDFAKLYKVLFYPADTTTPLERERIDTIKYILNLSNSQTTVREKYNKIIREVGTLDAFGGMLASEFIAMIGLSGTDNLLDLINSPYGKIIFGEKVVTEIQNGDAVDLTDNTRFNKMNDINTPIRELMDIFEEFNTYPDFYAKLQQLKKKLDAETEPSAILAEIIPVVGGSLGTSGLFINSSIETYLTNLKLNELIPIANSELGINIDGYDNSIYGPTPKFDYKYLLKTFSDDEYANFVEENCTNESGETKKLKYNNPGVSRYFKPNTDVFYQNVLVSELPKPTRTGERYSYTYSIVKDKYDGAFNTRFGRIFNFTEIGAKHNVISYNDPLLVSGELAIVRDSEENYTYKININSSKMNSAYSRLDNLNGVVSNAKTNVLYYIIMINLALNIFKLIDPSIADKIRPSDNFVMKYGNTPSERTGEQLVDYYKDAIKKCPPSDFITNYTKFGEKNKINACAGYKTTDSKYENIKEINFNEKKLDVCEHMDYDDNTFKVKYLKYKAKYINLKKLKKIK